MSERSVARQLLVWQLITLVLLILTAVGFAWIDARRDAMNEAERQVVSTALAVADAPSVVAAFSSEDPTTTLQPFAERVRRDTGTDFVVIMSTSGVRYTHPNPANIGGVFKGSISQARDGHVYVEEYTGTLGRSVRAVVPVRKDASVVGLVSVGIATTAVREQVLDALGPILAVAAGVAVLGLLAAGLVSRRLRRLTHGLGEREITRMFEYYDAVLRAVREGLVLVDPEGMVTLVNDEARRLLPDAEVTVGTPVASLGLGARVAAAIADGEPAFDEQVAIGRAVLLVSVAPARWRGHRVGSVVTLRDRTQLQEVLTELDTVRSLAESMRAQNHEAANRLHTIVSLVELGHAEEAIDFGTRAVQVAQGLADRVVASVDDPVVAALLLGKTAQAAERGVELEVDADSQVIAMPTGPADAVTLIGNLCDNAIEAAQGSARPQVRVFASADEFRLDVVVEDSGPGVRPDVREAVFTRGWSTKSSEGRGIGLALVGDVVRRHDGRIHISDSSLGGARFEVELGEHS